MNNRRAEFSAVLDDVMDVYGEENTKSYHFTKIRAKGALISPSLILMQKDSSDELAHLLPGDYVNFSACFELHDVKLSYPHNKIKKY
jgi:hypothetical protein